MSFMRWRQPHRGRDGVKRHIGALDVAAGQLLGYRTRAGGENRSRAYIHASETFSYSDPTTALCNLINCDFSSPIHAFNKCGQ